MPSACAGAATAVSVTAVSAAVTAAASQARRMEVRVRMREHLPFRLSPEGGLRTGTACLRAGDGEFLA
ncbi:hypothetical protein BTZ20_4720 [Rhodococcus sp. MTM3W5.2]|nr:hypothetical protein BTZ20_4720 [Rhodococcus sp. MTM3W5.2]